MKKTPAADFGLEPEMQPVVDELLRRMKDDGDDGSESELDVHFLAWAVSNCHILARRELNPLQPYVNPDSLAIERWQHVLRNFIYGFIAYYTHGGGCSNCGSLPHTTTCIVSRFEKVLEHQRLPSQSPCRS